MVSRKVNVRHIDGAALHDPAEADVESAFDHGISRIGDSGRKAIDAQQPRQCSPVSQTQNKAVLNDEEELPCTD